jgi:hypothetical protein
MDLKSPWQNHFLYYDLSGLGTHFENSSKKNSFKCLATAEQGKLQTSIEKKRKNNKKSRPILEANKLV